MEPTTTTNWTLIIIALIGAVPGAIAAIFAGLALWKSGVIQKSVDGMKSDLVSATAGKNKAEGQIQGAEEERARQETHTEEKPLPIKITNKRTKDQKAANSARKGSIE
jgi:hypothetical protein